MMTGLVPGEKKRTVVRELTKLLELWPLRARKKRSSLQCLQVLYVSVVWRSATRNKIVGPDGIPLFKSIPKLKTFIWFCPRGISPNSSFECRQADGFSTMAKHHPDLVMCRKQPGIGELVFSHLSLNLRCARALFHSITCIIQAPLYFSSLYL